MNGLNEAAKVEVKVSAAVDPQESLDPCAKPQAQEALRLGSVDDACDDGVK
jgi:hypothetical protein